MRKSNFRPVVWTAAGSSRSRRKWTASHLGNRCGCPVKALASTHRRRAGPA